MHRLKNLLSPLRKTPLHPQWLVLRSIERARHSIENAVHGDVLDIGCGNRWLERNLPQDSYYVGLDYPHTVSLGYAGRPNVFGNGQCLPFASNSFDCVVLMDVLEHLPSPEASISEAWRVLRTGGTLLIQVPFIYPLHDEPHDFQRWSEYGLKILLNSYHFDLQELTCDKRPIETATTLLTIALAHCTLDAFSKKHLSILITPLLISTIPIINFVGWILAKVLPTSSIMPTSYRIVARKS